MKGWKSIGELVTIWKKFVRNCFWKLVTTLILWRAPKIPLSNKFHVLNVKWFKCRSFVWSLAAAWMGHMCVVSYDLWTCLTLVFFNYAGFDTSFSKALCCIFWWMMCITAWHVWMSMIFSRYVIVCVALIFLHVEACFFLL